MTVETFLDLRGDASASEALDLAEWVHDALQVGWLLRTTTVRALHEIATGSVSDVLAALPQWVQDGAAQRCGGWAPALAAEIQREIVGAIHEAADCCTIEYEVEASIYIGGELYATESYYGEDLSDALGVVESLGDDL
jgi:hypothetical protein